VFCTKNQEPKIVEECSYPLTGVTCVDLVITDLAVIAVTPAGLVLREVAPGVSVEEVQQRTDARLRVADDVREMRLT
jgi:3-oxoacid CoA-transferase subunit B